MAVYFVSTAGNDANNGLGPDASHATNKPWLTIGKALGAAGISSGDTVHIGPGVYREIVNVAMTSAVAETFVKGDPRNKNGFKDGSGVLLAAQPVRWTSWTTDDKAASSTSRLLTLTNKDFLTFEDIFCISRNETVFSNTGIPKNITFRRCFIQSLTARCISITGTTALQTASWLVESCLLSGIGGSQFGFTPSGAGADWDLDITIRNCVIQSANTEAVTLTRGAVNTFLGGGVKVYNCTIIGATGIRTVGSTSTTFPCYVRNCIVIAAGTGINAANAGEIVEDYNVIYASTARTNVTAGANSTTTYSPMLDYGQSQLWGFLPRPPFSPTFDSPMLGFGTDGGVSLSTDLLERDRPSGPGITWANALKAVGCFEYHDFAQKDTSGDVGDGWILTGPGDQDIQVPVDATSTTISIRVRYDTNHGTGSKPQAELLSAEDIGVASGQTLTASVGVDTWETLTFSAITPTSKSWVTIRLRSRSAAGNGVAKFDTLAVT